MNGAMRWMEVEVVVAVYWLACGASYRVTADAFEMPLSTVCRTVYGVVEEMMAILHMVIHFPKAEEMEGLALLAWQVTRPSDVLLGPLMDATSKFCHLQSRRRATSIGSSSLLSSVRASGTRGQCMMHSCSGVLPFIGRPCTHQLGTTCWVMEGTHACSDPWPL
ncbi:unnamed protein product [Arctogadus glacialis]